MHLEKNWVDQIQNGRYKMTITIKQTVRFQERMHFEKIQSAIIHFNIAGF